MGDHSDDADAGFPPNDRGTILQDDATWWLNACIWAPVGSLGAYAMGYRRAADLLVEHVERTGQDQDFLLCPVGQLYRHAVELQLKQLLFELERLFGRPHKLRDRHSVEALWRECRTMLEEAKIADDPAVGPCEHYLRELHKIDPSGQVFRYPTDTKGRGHFPSGTLRISIPRLKETLGGLVSVLGAACDMVEHLADCQPRPEEH